MYCLPLSLIHTLTCIFSQPRFLTASRTHSPRGGVGGVLDMTRGIGGEGGGGYGGRRGSGVGGRRGSRNIGDDEEEEEEGVGYDENTLDWIEVTSMGEILGPQAFRAKQLGLGTNTRK